MGVLRLEREWFFGLLALLSGAPGKLV